MHVPTLDFGITITATEMTNRLFCKLDGLSPTVREQNRVTTLKKLGLLEMESIPIFDEATQMAARFIECPMCILTLMVFDQVWIKSAVGLSRLGLMNRLASERKISRPEAFCTYVVDSQQSLNIEDTWRETVFAESSLAQDYGIRSYLGVPLITAAGQCIGSLGLMDLNPRHFSLRELEFLSITARWCMGEFERNYWFKRQTEITQEAHLLERKLSSAIAPLTDKQGNSPKSDFMRSLDHIKLKLINQLTQEIRTPLTAVIGMSSVLKGGVFGKLNDKQREYLEIIHRSGEYMNVLVEEVLKIGALEETSSQLELTPINVEMLAQKALNSLSEIAKQKRQEIRLSAEPGKRVWLLDKTKVHQALYYLVISIIDASEPDGEIRVHISHRSQNLHIALWMYHPWIGDGLPHIHWQPPLTLEAENSFDQSCLSFSQHYDQTQDLKILTEQHHPVKEKALTVVSLEAILLQLTNGPNSGQEKPQKLLGLLLGCYLAESHGGKVVIQGSPESGYRYVLILPQIAMDGTLQE
ncbi:MAG: GAF domain-containing sensor histidine kinase [Snowella sp.]|nr:GAF domain-containing sensor histidine kinase [Snowella sp.]